MNQFNVYDLMLAADRGQRTPALDRVVQLVGSTKPADLSRYVRDQARRTNRPLQAVMADRPTLA